jgi:hypothetical protein
VRSHAYLSAAAGGLPIISGRENCLSFVKGVAPERQHRMGSYSSTFVPGAGAMLLHELQQLAQDGGEGVAGVAEVLAMMAADDDIEDAKGNGAGAAWKARTHGVFRAMTPLTFPLTSRVTLYGAWPLVHRAYYGWGMPLSPEWPPWCHGSWMSFLRSSRLALAARLVKRPAAGMIVITRLDITKGVLDLETRGPPVGNRP